MSNDLMTTTEWGVMELAPKRRHGNTLPKNQVRAGHVRPCATREEAEQFVAWRAECSPHSPLAVVARNVTITPWVVPAEETLT